MLNLKNMSAFSSNLMEYVCFFIQSDGICATMIVSFGRARRKCATANLRTQKSTQIHEAGETPVDDGAVSFLIDYVAP